MTGISWSATSTAYVSCPREIEEEVFTRALEKARGERMVLKKIQEGMKARDAFDTYGIM